jgi:hypothetical protein
MKTLVNSCFAFVLILAGCVNSEKLAIVEGTVTIDGKPLSTGIIVFETTGARPATGQIKDGKIVNWENGGVPLGTHKVSITAIEEIATTTPTNPGDVGSGSLASMSGKSLIPPRYGDPNKSGLSALIKSGINEVQFQLVSDADSSE